ncbi:MAG: HU family DNA-binding protein [Coprobacter sp.]|nr:HU family DNA-binding protein [Coprobacter sp.]
MEHKQFFATLQEHLGKDKKEVDNLYSGLLQIIKERSLSMDSISIQGFGVFEPRKKLERVTVNPATGKRMLIPPRIVLTFKPGAVLKSRIKENPAQ